MIRTLIYSLETFSGSSKEKDDLRAKINLLLDDEISTIKLCEPYRLSEGQIDIIKKCIIKKRACVPLKMGGGKTLISLAFILLLFKIYNESDIGPTVVVVQKTLVAEWIKEIKKFFGDTLKYQVVTSITKDFQVTPGIHMIITLPTVLGKCYKERRIIQLFTRRETVLVNRWMTTEKTIYNTNPQVPYLREYTGIGYFYSTIFRGIIVDEVHRYTRIITQRSQAIASVTAMNRILLSGTTFDEPDTSRILGYHVILGDKSFPNNLVDTETLIHSEFFGGLKSNYIKTTKSIKFNDLPPYKLNKHIVDHSLSNNEMTIYIQMKKTLNILKNTISVSASRQDIDNVRKFNSYVLSMITYIRQGIVCPLLPLSTIAVNMLDLQSRSELSLILNNQFEKLGINNWLNDESSVKSSRIVSLLEKMENHRQEKMVVFTCFRTSIDIIEYYVKQAGYTTFKLTSSMNSIKRGNVIEEFEKSPTGSVMLLTYELGAEGHNLQFASALFIVDFWWNVGRVNQAIARIARPGQTRDVNIYFFTSNTGMEKALFVKQQDKLQALSELENGQRVTKVNTLKMDEVLQLIDSFENIDLMRNLHG